MTQTVFDPIDPVPTSGVLLASLLNALRLSLLSGHSGASRPSYAQAGTCWVKTAATPWIFYFFDGAHDLPICDVNATTGVLRLYHAGEVLGALALKDSIASGDISAGAIITAALGSKAVTQEKLGDASVGAAQIKTAESAAILNALLGTATNGRIIKGNGTTFELSLPQISVSSDDASPGFLSTKFVAGSLLTAEVFTDSGVKKFRLKIANGTPNALLGFDESGSPAVLTGGGVPVGVVDDYAGLVEPSGWLFCFGQAVSRDTYADLFTVIGTTYGIGDGSTTFNVPDLRGRVVAGQDDMGGTSANRLTGLSGGVDGDVLGSVGGSQSHTLTTAEMPSHSHPLSLSNSSFSGSVARLSTDALMRPETNTYTPPATGGGGAHNNVQPTIILNKIIKF